MPLYCFGYGKSYTEFEMKTINVTADEKQVQVEVEVTNIGDKYPEKKLFRFIIPHRWNHGETNTGTCRIC